MITALLKAGADPNIQGQFNLTPLHVVMEDFDYWQNAHWEVRSALRHEHNERQGNWIGSDPSSRNKAVNALLEAGANLNAQDQYGDTPLHRAALNNRNVAIIEMLVAAGTDPNARTDNGDTPLRRAAKSNNDYAAAIIEALLAGGANPDAHIEKDATPLRAGQNNDGLKESGTDRNLEERVPPAQTSAPSCEDAIAAPPCRAEGRLIHSTFEGPCRSSFVPKPRPLTMASSPNFSRTASSALSTLLSTGPKPPKRLPWATWPASTRS